jgi:urease accessory protein
MDSRLRGNDGGGGVMQASALLNLLQFASPALPIGAYSYSQGLEAALQNGAVHNAGTARAWILRHLHEVVAQWEAPVCWRLMRAWSRRDWPAVAEWSERFIASRDSAEFRAETIQMGYSLTKLVAELGFVDAEMLAQLQGEPEVALPTAFACAVAALDIPHDAALLAMLFAWAENQVLVCVKSVPLGQVAGQRMLLSLRADIEAAARHAQTVADDDMSNWAPGLSLLSMQHEVQYSRLYRS